MPALPAPGDRLAGFLLERELGHGATGVVFLATEVALGRRVALKVVGPPLAHDPAFRWRFLREARIAAALDHPNVVTVLQHGSDDDRLWLAMRLVDGPDLRVLLRRTGSLDPEQAVEIVEQVAAALDAAHAAGLVHRDVKPGNVLVEDRPGRRMHAELADFGLADAAGGPPGGPPWAGAGAAPESATARAAASAPAAPTPAVGAAIPHLGGRALGRSPRPTVGGTPGYAAPEQLRGAEPTVAADVHALGCVLFEALTGVAPEPAAVDAGRGAGPTVGGAASASPTAAGDAADRDAASTAAGRTTGLRPSAVVPRLGTAFDAVVAAATDPDPAARPSTAGAVARAAREALGHAAASRAAVARAVVRPATPAEVAAGAAAVGAVGAVAAAGRSADVGRTFGAGEAVGGGAASGASEARGAGGAVGAGATVGAGEAAASGRAAGPPAPTLGAGDRDPAPVTREALWRAPARRARWTVPLAAGGLLVVLGGAYAAVDRVGDRPPAGRTASPASTPLRADARGGTATRPGAGPSASASASRDAGDDTGAGQDARRADAPGAAPAGAAARGSGATAAATGASRPPAPGGSATGAADTADGTAEAAGPTADAAAGPDAPAVGGRAPYAAATPPAPPVPDGYRRFGGGAWTLDLPVAAGWRQTATQELERGARVLTRLRRADGARLVVEHLPGRTAVLGPAAGAGFSVRLPRLGRTRGGVFTGGRYAMCRTGVCAAIPANGAAGGVLLVAAAPDARAARRLVVAAARHARVG